MGSDSWAEKIWFSDSQVESDKPLPINLHLTHNLNSIKTDRLLHVLDGTEHIQKLSPHPEIRMYELTVRVCIAIGHKTLTASALIDTGCRIPLLIRTGLIPKHFMTKASRIIKILTADNSPMNGGHRGCKVQITLPVQSTDCDSSSQLRCKPTWCYECDLFGSDVIIGYPFLKLNHLTVDCPKDALRHTTPTTSTSCSDIRLQTSPTTVTNVSHRVEQLKNPNPTDELAGVSRCPPVSPGSKANDPRPQDIRATSSYLDIQQQRILPDSSTAELSVHIQPVRYSEQHPPDSTLTELSEADPPDTTTTPRDTPCTTSFGTTTTLHKCTQCNRITNQQNYDCGCLDGTNILLPVSERQVSSVLESTMVPTINVMPYKTYKRDTPSMDWWEDLHHVNDVQDLLLDGDWFQFQQSTEYFCRILGSVPSHPENILGSLPSQSKSILGDRFTADTLNVLGNRVTNRAMDSQSIATKYLVDPRILGRENMLGSVPCMQLRRLQHALYSADYRIRSEVFERILDFAKEQDMYPEVDAFSSKADSRLKSYWSSHSDAFRKTWSDKILWINPPIRQLSRIVEKILCDEARGLILVPIRQSAKWFIILSYIARCWYDFPSDEILFEDPRGTELPPIPQITFRLIIFDAYNIQQSLNIRTRPEFGQSPQDLSKSERVLTLVTNNKYVVRSAIESASPHPKARELEAQLRKNYEDVMEHPVYARDIDPTIRGPFGVARIELKDGAKPLHKKFVAQVSAKKL